MDAHGTGPFHMYLSTRQLVLLATLSACAGTGTAASLLDSLGTELRALRALPAGEATHAACPEHLEALRGIHQSDVRSALGSPDFIDAAQSRWTYVLSSPRKGNTLGGGHPELHLAFDAAHTVVDARCVRAR